MTDSDGGFYAPDDRGRNDQQRSGDSCGEAIMASLKAMGRHCDMDGVPLQTSSGHVVMAPQEEMEQVKNAAPGDMTDRELLDFIEESPWLGSWCRSLCEKAGLDAGTKQYQDCLLAYARDALGE
jgi:hypothetical protein